MPLGSLLLLVAEHLAQLLSLLADEAVNFGVADGRRDLAEDIANELGLVRDENPRLRTPQR